MHTEDPYFLRRQYCSRQSDCVRSNSLATPSPANFRVPVASAAQKLWRNDRDENIFCENFCSHADIHELQPPYIQTSTKALLPDTILSVSCHLLQTFWIAWWGHTPSNKQKLLLRPKEATQLRVPNETGSQFCHWNSLKNLKIFLL